MIKKLKPAYALYNFFHRKQLIHNSDKFKKIGLNKSYYSPISAKDFEGIDGSALLADPAKLDVRQLDFYNNLPTHTQQEVDQFNQKGYAVLRGLMPTETVDDINAEIDRLLESGEIAYKYRNKLMFVIHKSPMLRDICNKLMPQDFLNGLIQGDAKLFQSINFINGSEQMTHSDSIHMTTFPQGGLLGVWIALEKIDAGNGSIHYYPGSHTLPYMMNDTFDNQGNGLFLGKSGYPAYERMIDKMVKERQLEKQVFDAMPGDVFIWHANLLHGGEAHVDKSRTRKSMVLHYFDKNRVCYHEITQRPALFQQ